MTMPERLLWKHLSHQQMDGFKFRRQHPAGPFILDFYCPDLKLRIEVDGDQHGRDEGVVHDRNRDAYLKDRDIEILRF